jgi:hypothetical protein
MADVYDGNIWAEFQEYDGVPFLADTGIALMLNTDGFQPMKSTRPGYSTEGIYLAIMNLPRAIRYLKENMILVGLVPGGRAKTDLQHFTKPLVDEMLELWKVDNKLGRRVAILCVACDIPAARALGGFSGHTARTEGPRRVCTYPADPARKKSTYFGSVGVDGAKGYRPEDAYPKRSRTEWVDAGKEWTEAKYNAARERVRKSTGCRYSELQRLPYMTPRMFVVDPFHCIWEGLFRDLLNMMINRPGYVATWNASAEDGAEPAAAANGPAVPAGDPLAAAPARPSHKRKRGGDRAMDLSEDDQEEQTPPKKKRKTKANQGKSNGATKKKTAAANRGKSKRCQKKKTAAAGDTEVAKWLKVWEEDLGRWTFPSSIGPMLGKVGHKLAGIKGAELKNLLNICFHTMSEGRVTEEETGLITLLAEASRLCESKLLQPGDITKLESTLVKYCENYEHVYGGSAVKPNHRQCLEIARCMEDYGPGVGFWLFPLERWNGILSNLRFKFVDLECSMMRAHNTLWRAQSIARPGNPLFDAMSPSQQETIYSPAVLGDTTGTSVVDGEAVPAAWRWQPALLQSPAPWHRLAKVCGERLGDNMVHFVRTCHPRPALEDWGRIRGSEWFPGTLEGAGVPITYSMTSRERDAIQRGIVALFKWSSFDPRTGERSTVHVELLRVERFTALVMCGDRWVASTAQRAAAGAGHFLISAPTAPAEAFEGDATTVPEPAHVSAFLRVFVRVSSPGVDGHVLHTLVLARTRWYQSTDPLPSQKTVLRYRMKFDAIYEKKQPWTVVPVHRLLCPFVSLPYGDNPATFAVGRLPSPFTF